MYVCMYVCVYVRMLENETLEMCHMVIATEPIKTPAIRLKPFASWSLAHQLVRISSKRGFPSFSVGYGLV
ncbi:hypothetical protein DUNSADRAFT_16364 [Dunaliella salina]|uniref:Encoded protein n=1 Tax=Dunaliella salina TaxID=3046 RepID=A0ABQ7G3T4_DUNSA|nr:hypothetical protein DUNSADRAFT_16364 [Dunaliella salina]|eukprot:KAF5829251.1 hypothetical protein DUNSADRAFT_16364 [Dunaliella salina]